MALALLQVECGRHSFACHGMRYAIDRPPVESRLGGVVLRKGHLKNFVGSGRGGASLRKARVVPPECRRNKPLRLSDSPGILHDYPHPVSAVIVVEVTKDPYPGMIHVDYRRYPFRRSKPHYWHSRWVWHGIPIQCNNMK